MLLAQMKQPNQTQAGDQEASSTTAVLNMFSPIAGSVPGVSAQLRGCRRLRFRRAPSGGSGAVGDTTWLISVAQRTKGDHLLGP